jgi:hypothetical protein
MQHVTITITAQALAEGKRLGTWNDCDRKDIIMYTVHSDVWAEAGLAPNAGWICPPCLAKKLRRPLMPDDFDVMPVVVDGVEVTGLR